MRKPARSGAPRVRWYLIRALEASRPVAASETLLCDVLDGADMRVTARDVRRDLDFCRLAGLVEIDQRDPDLWSASLTLKGVLYASGESEDIIGIDRPREGL